MKGLIHFVLVILLVPFTAFSSTEQNSLKINLSIQDEDVSISWVSISEVDAFVIEVATETDKNGNLIFNELVRLEASTQKQYKYIDKTPKSHGLRYYRLKQLSSKGGILTSDVRTVNFQFKDSFATTISTGKDLSTVDLAISSKRDCEATISLSSISHDGYNTMQTVYLNRGMNNFTIPVDPNIAIGKYLFTIGVNSDVQIVLLQKEEMNELIVSDE